MNINLLNEIKSTKLYLYLEEDYKNLLIASAIKKAGSQSLLARKLKSYFKSPNLSQANISFFIKKKTLRLDFIISLCKYLKIKLDKSKIKGIKGESTTQLILNPKLNIKLTPELASLLANLYCDGCIEFRNGFITKYTNNNEELISHFKRNFNQAFGFITFQSNFNKLNQVWNVRIPCFIGKFLFYKFNIYNNKVPIQIKKASLKIKSAYLRAVFDDEGSIARKTAQIRLKMKYKSYIKDIRNLLQNDFQIKCSKIIKEINRGFKCYYFSISGITNLKKFHNNINLIHPKKQGYIIKRLNESKGNYGYNAKNLVFALLKKEPKTSKELAFTLSLDRRTIQHHLAKLKKQNKVSYKKLKKKLVYEYLWFTKNVKNFNSL